MDDGHLVLAGADGSGSFLAWAAARRCCHRRDRCRAAVRPSGRVARGGGGAARRRSGLAAYAAALLSWHRRHRFCANCGAPTEVVDAGHERHCPRCDAHHFPRTDPVVIVRVIDTRADRLLLGRSPRWPQAATPSSPASWSPVRRSRTPCDARCRRSRESSWEECRGFAAVAVSQLPSCSAQAVAEPGEPQADDDELEDVRWFERAAVLEAAQGRGPVRLAALLDLAPPDRRLARRSRRPQERSGRSG